MRGLPGDSESGENPIITITLEAANPKYPPIVPQTELHIAGVITALVRKYK